MSVMLISVSHNTIVGNKHEEQTRHYNVNFQQTRLLSCTVVNPIDRNFIEIK